MVWPFGHLARIPIFLPNMGLAHGWKPPNVMVNISHNQHFIMLLVLPYFKNDHKLKKTQSYCWLIAFHRIMVGFMQAILNPDDIAIKSHHIPSNIP